MYEKAMCSVMTNIDETMHFKSYIVFALLDEQTERYFTLCKRIWDNIDEREYSINFVQCVILNIYCISTLVRKMRFINNL
jgi:hypothetical protein